jgi:hypothetical protein
MDLPPDIMLAVVKVAIAGGIAGVVGGLIASMRASLFGSFFMGALAGLSMASIVNISGLDPFNDSLILDAGAGFSYAWAALGGVFMGYVVTKSSGGAGKSKMWHRR